MRIIFIRHGERSDHGNGGLTVRGRDMADRARSWLAANDLQPTHAVCTRTARTCETAAIVLAGRGIDPTLRSGLPDVAANWLAYLDQLSTIVPDHGVVLLVGHGPTQWMLERMYPHVALPEVNRCCAFLLDRTPAGAWACSACYPGSPSAAA